MRLIFIIFCICLISPDGMGQGKETYLRWGEENRLQWAHFRGMPDAGDVVHAAVTYAGIDLRVEKVNIIGEITFSARAVFDQQKSWAHPRGRNRELLAHEQLHFDITEVYARRLEKRLNALNLRKNDKAKIKKLRQLYSQAQLAAQELYDKETIHGIHEDKQRRWALHIRELLRNPGTGLYLKQPVYAVK